MSKEHRIAFRVDTEFLTKLEQLSCKLGIGRSEAIRVCIDDGIRKYLDPKYRGEVMAIYTEQLDRVITALEKRIEKLHGLKN